MATLIAGEVPVSVSRNARAGVTERGRRLTEPTGSRDKHGGSVCPTKLKLFEPVQRLREVLHGKPLQTKKLKFGCHRYNSSQTSGIVLFSSQI